MNPLIEYYKNDRGIDGNFAKGTPVKEHSKEILELLNSATEEERDEFLEWGQNPLPADWKQPKAQK